MVLRVQKGSQVASPFTPKQTSQAAVLDLEMSDFTAIPETKEQHLWRQESMALLGAIC